MSDAVARARPTARPVIAAGPAIAILAAAIALAPRAGSQSLPDGPLEVPSRQLVTLQEAFFEEQEDGAIWLRLRFVAPRIGAEPGQYGFDLVEWDMVHLCEAVGIPFAAAAGAEMIVVSLANAPIPFGESNDEVTQFFEAYRPVDGACEWEEF